ncbi:MAG: DinB family protein [Gemmatimonadaceae bacterium]
MTDVATRAPRAPETAEQYIARLLAALGSRDPIDVLRATAQELRRAIAGLDDAQLGTPEAPGLWSVRDVIQHLADSELVGAFRIRMVLAHDRPILVGYDQERWAQRLHYDKTHVQEALTDFERLRLSNLCLLDETSAAERERVGLHSERGRGEHQPDDPQLRRARHRPRSADRAHQTGNRRLTCRRKVVMRHVTALPFFLRRSEDVIAGGEITSTAETVHGLIRIEGDRIVLQWRVSRETDRVGREIRTDRELDPVREVAVPLSGVSAAKVRASWWPWSGARLVLTAADLRAFEHVVGKGGLRLDHPAELVLRLRLRERLAAQEFAGELELVLAEQALRAADVPGAVAPGEAAAPLLPRARDAKQEV